MMHSISHLGVDGSADLSANSEYLLNLHPVQVQGFRGLREAVKDLLHHCNIHFDQNGLLIQAMDGNVVALVHVKFPAENFDQYFCERDLSIGIDIARTLRFFKNIDSTDSLQLFIKKEDPNYLGVCISSKQKNTILTFKEMLIDIDEDEIEIPSIEINDVITMQSADLHNYCRMMKFAETVEITSINDQLVFRCKKDRTEMCLRLGGQETPDEGEGDSEDLDTEGQEESEDQTIQQNVVRNTFLLKYLELFTKAYNLVSTVDIVLINDFPLILNYNIANLGVIKFCLAPYQDPEE